eukprot:Sro33_g021750.1 n/a (374) ;mRNA; r:157288-158409
MWLNGVIVYQIHYVLQKSNQFVKVPPPTVQHVCKQVAATYFVAALFFGWAMFLYLRGLVVFSLSTVVNVWIGTRVVMVAPPFFYVSYVGIDVWYRNLLPASGRTRVLSLYFLRVIIVFMLTWIPYFIIYEIAWNVTHSRWMVHCSYYLGSLQGLVSVAVAMSKPDVKRAVLRFLNCQCRTPDIAGPEGGAWGTTSRTQHQSIFAFSRIMGSGHLGIRSATFNVSDSNPHRSTEFSLGNSQDGGLVQIRREGEDALSDGNVLAGAGAVGFTPNHTLSVWDQEDKWDDGEDAEDMAIAIAGENKTAVAATGIPDKTNLVTHQENTQEDLWKDHGDEGEMAKELAKENEAAVAATTTNTSEASPVADDNNDSFRNE